MHVSCPANGNETGQSSDLMSDLIEKNIGWLHGWLGSRLTGHRRQDVDDLCQDILLKAIRGVG